MQVPSGASWLIGKGCPPFLWGFGRFSSFFVSGVGAGREQAIRAFTGSGINVNGIKDTTPVAHNGVRQRKPRRV